MSKVIYGIFFHGCRKDLIRLKIRPVSLRLDKVVEVLRLLYKMFVIATPLKPLETKTSINVFS